MPRGNLTEMDNISILDFDWSCGKVVATVFEKGTLKHHKRQIGFADFFLDEEDIQELSENCRPIIGYVTEDPEGRPFFYSARYEHGELL